VDRGFYRRCEHYQKEAVTRRRGECESLGLLAAYSLISLIGKDEAQARQDLLSSIADAIAIAKGGRAKPAVPPGFPGEGLSQRIHLPVFPAVQPVALHHGPTTGVSSERNSRSRRHW
jgi:hypothetical protein